MYGFYITYKLRRGCKKAEIDRLKRLSSREKTSRIATNVYLRKTLEKPKRRRSTYSENESSRVVYARGRY